jgi:hypothetical protein
VEQSRWLISPVWQQVWKTVEGQEWRLGISQNWKLPTSFQLIPRRYRVDDHNSPFNPDQTGNPALKPEAITGIDSITSANWMKAVRWSLIICTSDARPYRLRSDADKWHLE